MKAKYIVIGLFILVIVFVGPRYEKQKEFRVLIDQSNFASRIIAYNSGVAPSSSELRQFITKVTYFFPNSHKMPELKVFRVDLQMEGEEVIDITKSSKVNKPDTATIEKAYTEWKLGVPYSIETSILIMRSPILENGVADIFIYGEFCVDNECKPLAQHVQIESFFQIRFYTLLGDYISKVMSV